MGLPFGNVYEANLLNVAWVGLMVYVNAQIMWSREKKTGKCVSDGSGVEENAANRPKIVVATSLNFAMDSDQACLVLTVSSRPDMDYRWPMDHGMSVMGLLQERMLSIRPSHRKITQATWQRQRGYWAALAAHQNGARLILR